MVTQAGDLRSEIAADAQHVVRGVGAAPAPYVHVYSVDTERVPELTVRQAIATAYPAVDVLAASGEDGVPRTT
ncbi:hypothetical protein [Streptomyces sp. NPDC093544]|uniref:hypothetical protein n=1 Tax=Streptomyces sp. NPDC093544 TaxID=3155200 RepID=UPI0034449E5E